MLRKAIIWLLRVVVGLPEKKVENGQLAQYEPLTMPDLLSALGEAVTALSANVQTLLADELNRQDSRIEKRLERRYEKQYPNNESTDLRQESTSLQEHSNNNGKRRIGQPYRR